VWGWWIMIKQGVSVLVCFSIGLIGDMMIILDGILNRDPN
jgi:hypothetical protein